VFIEPIGAAIENQLQGAARSRASQRREVGRFSPLQDVAAGDARESHRVEAIAAAEHDRARTGPGCFNHIAPTASIK
jgi:hypothetical protein